MFEEAVKHTKGATRAEMKNRYMMVRVTMEPFETPSNKVEAEGVCTASYVNEATQSGVYLSVGFVNKND